MTRPFRFGVVAPIRTDLPTWRDSVRRIADSGYSTLLMPDVPQWQPAPGPALAVAASLTDVRVGTWVYASPLRQPWMTAWEAHSLSVLTDGRFEMGIGTGRPGIEDQMRELGLPAVPAGERLVQVRETVRALRDLDGPDRHTPVAMAVRGPKALALAAEVADTVNFALSEGESRAEVARLARDLRAVRDVELALHVSVVGDTVAPFMAPPDTDPAALRAVDSLAVLPDDPAAAADEIQRRREQLGFSYFVFGAGSPGPKLAAVPAGKTAAGQVDHGDRTAAVHKTLEFPDLLPLIDERATAFRAVIASAPSLDVQVPTCPEWTLFDLAQHLGQGRRFRAATIAAGPADAAPAEAVAERTVPAPREREQLLAWLAATTQELLDALRAADPDGSCWTGWGATQLTDTCGSVARHQLQEIAVHTYDAQVAVGAPQPLPTEVALDGVEENLFITCFTTSPWPHKPTAFDLHATEGRSWRHTLDGDGARTTRLPAPDEDPDAAGLSIHGTASDLVLFLYERIPLDSLQLDGDPGLFDLFHAWDWWA